MVYISFDLPVYVFLLDLPVGHIPDLFQRYISCLQSCPDAFIFPFRAIFLHKLRQNSYKTNDMTYNNDISKS